MLGRLLHALAMKAFDDLVLDIVEDAVWIEERHALSADARYII